MKPHRSTTLIARAWAALTMLSVFATFVPATTAAQGPAQLQRLRGTAGFLRSALASPTGVDNVQTLPPGAIAYAGCLSLAAVSFQDASSVTLGANTRLALAPDSGPLAFDRGTLRFDVDRASDKSRPLVIRTPYGTLNVNRGSGFAVAGSKGLQVIAVDSAAKDISFSAAGTTYDIAGGQTLTVRSDRAKPALDNNASINNPQIYQYNDGRNPLGLQEIAPLDPTGSPPLDCLAARKGKSGFPASSDDGSLQGAVAGNGGSGGGSGLILGGLGVAALAALALGSSGKGKSGTPAPTQNPGTMPPTSPSPSGSGTPSARPSGSPTASATPTAPPILPSLPPLLGPPTPSPAASGTPRATPQASPTPLRTASPSPSPSPTPLGLPSPSLLSKPKVR